jgi:hypothetical protein
VDALVSRYGPARFQVMLLRWGEDVAAGRIARLPLPFEPETLLTLPEKYAALVALHDAVLEPVNPWRVVLNTPLPVICDDAYDDFKRACFDTRAMKFAQMLTDIRSRKSAHSTAPLVGRYLPQTRLTSWLAEIEKDLAAQGPARRPTATAGTEQAGQGEPAEAASNAGPDSPTGFLGGAELADALGVHPTRRDAFVQQLGRLRKSLGDDRIEANCPRPNSPRYLYRADSPALCKLAAAYKTP